MGEVNKVKRPRFGISSYVENCAAQFKNQRKVEISEDCLDLFLPAGSLAYGLKDRLLMLKHRVNVIKTQE